MVCSFSIKCLHRRCFLINFASFFKSVVICKARRLKVMASLFYFSESLYALFFLDFFPSFYDIYSEKYESWNNEIKISCNSVILLKRDFLTRVYRVWSATLEIFDFASIKTYFVCSGTMKIYKENIKFRYDGHEF